MKNIINRLMAGEDLTFDEAQSTMVKIMEGTYSDIQIAGFLTALQTKGPTTDEIAGFASTMRDKMVPVPITVDAIDMCGTGGDGSGTFNISTAASFVVAGAGVPLAKHGNRSISSKSGSADVLMELGVDINVSADQMARAVDEIGIGFMFAPALHPAMKFVMPARIALGVRTVFNILGPLCNPASVKRQVIGVFDGKLASKMAGVLKRLGGQSGIIIHGSDGLDELTTTGESSLTQFTDSGEITTSLVTPESVGLPRATLADLAGGSPADNAKIITQIFAGEKGPKRDITVFNAAAGLVVAGRASSLAEGVVMAAESIDSRAAQKSLVKLVDFS